MLNPSVTIGIPAFNSRRDFLEGAVHSLLSQDYPDIELVISDDGSDPSAAALYDEVTRQDARARVVHQDRNQGHAWNFARLVKEARGRYFLLGSDDDIRSPSFVRNAVELLDRNSNAIGASSPVMLVTPELESIQPVVSSPLLASRLLNDRIRSLLSGTVQFEYYALFRTDALRKTSIHDAAVYDLWGIETLIVFELLLQGPILKVEGEDLRYRMRSNWNRTSLADYVLSQGLDKSHPLFWEESRRSRLIRRALLRYPLGPIPKAAAAVVLERVLWSSVFTTERQGFARQAFNIAVSQRDYLGACKAVAEYVAHSPAALFRRGAWKSLLRGSTNDGS